MAPRQFKKSKAGHPLVPSNVWSSRNVPSQLELRDPASQIALFLRQIGFRDTLAALEKEAADHGVHLKVDLLLDHGESPDSRLSTFVRMWEHYLTTTEHRFGGATLAEVEKEIEENKETEAMPPTFSTHDAKGKGDQPTGAAAVDSDSSGDDSDSSSDSSARAGQKRKRIMTPSSSDGSSSASDSDSDDEKMKDVAAKSSSSDSDSDSDSDCSSDSDRPLNKRSKLSHNTDGEPKSAAASDSEDDDVPKQHLSKKKSAKVPVKKAVKDKDSSSSDSDSDSSSGSSSDSGSKAKSKSSSGSSSSSSGSSSSSSSDSDSDSGSSSDSSSSDSSSSSSSSDSDSDSSSSSSSASPKKAKKSKKIKTKAKPAKVDSKRSGSTSSSATLVGDTIAKPGKQATDTLLIPDSSTTIGTKAVPATKENVRQLKKDHVPFSRIPTGQKIDPKFSSNDYVSYDYADRAYQDLSVTKGKGFTKEKNKKKRGAYRGGAIDLTPKAIKFDD